MPNLLPPQVATTAGKAITAVSKHGPDPVVFVFLALALCVVGPFLKPSWLVVVMFFALVGGYCLRMERVEKHKIDAANHKFDLEHARAKLLIETHRNMGGAVQPSLPLSSRPRRPNKS